MPRISHSHESYQSKPPRSKWGTVLARYDRTGALIAWQVRAYRNFCGAYNRGPALWEQACRPVIFVAWKMMRPRWWAGWRENAIQQSEEMPRIRDRHRLERIPHHHAIPQHHRLTTKTSLKHHKSSYRPEISGHPELPVARNR